MLALIADTAAGVTSGGPGILPIVMILGLLLYFIPTVVAFQKNHINKTAIFILNIFLGWTFIGWVIALIWSVIKKDTTT